MSGTVGKLKGLWGQCPWEQVTVSIGTHKSAARRGAEDLRPGSPASSRLSQQRRQQRQPVGGPACQDSCQRCMSRAALAKVNLHRAVVLLRLPAAHAGCLSIILLSHNGFTRISRILEDYGFNDLAFPLIPGWCAM